MYDIILKKIDEFDMYVLADDSITEDIYEFFKFLDPNHNPGPWTKWDGIIRLYDKRKRTLPIGLMWYILKWSVDHGYRVKIDPDLKERGDTTQVKEWLDKQVISNENGEEITLHWYQKEIVLDVLEVYRRTAVAATAAGKSLICYLLAKYHVEHSEADDKFLLLVSNVGLADQMENDFKDYSQLNGWDVDKFLHKIYSGKEKVTDKKIVCSTWQSIYELASDKKYFEPFTFFLGDECHEAQGKSIQKIGKALVNCKHRLGLTGTLQDGKSSKLQIESIFGKAKKYVSLKQLQDEGKGAKSKIYVCEIQYPESDKRHIYNEMKNTGEKKTLAKGDYYRKEVDFIIGHKARNELIVKMVNKMEGNTLVLFNYVENHGVPLFEMFKDSGGGKKYHIIHGGVKNREEIKKEMEASDGNVLLASYGTFAKGMNVKRIHNIVFASPSKSKIRVLQSLGRGIRLHKTKDYLRLYDLADNLVWWGKKNSTYKHMFERIKYYEKEELSYSMVNLTVAPSLV